MEASERMPMDPLPPDPPIDPLDQSYRTRPPWDIGAPQPALLALFDELPPSGPVLEVGCGTGELSLALARRGLAILGVDLAPAAIEQARAKAAQETAGLPGPVEFRAGDALHPTRFGGPFGAVVDAGFFHLFGAPERAQFVSELAAALAPGGRYYLLGFAIASPYPNAPRQVRPDELQALFTAERGWRTLVLRSAGFKVRLTANQVPAIAACFERVPSP
jgi:cyclopropane fatty-acyl-phospholipid synthase-like methyltransferase